MIIAITWRGGEDRLLHKHDNKSYMYVHVFTGGVTIQLGVYTDVNSTSNHIKEVLWYFV